MRSFFSGVALCAALGSLGCAAYRPVLTCPREGGPPWIEVSTKHFVLKTDHAEGAAREMSARIEQLAAALLQALRATADERALPVEVIVFERGLDMQAFRGGRDVVGFVGSFAPNLRGDVESRHLLMTSGPFEPLTLYIIGHVLTLEIVSRRSSRLPLWLQQGLGETYSTVRVEGGQIFVGEAPPRALSEETSPPSLDRLLGATKATVPEAEENLYYTSSWKLVRVLRGISDPSWSPRYDAMMDDLRRGTPGFEAFSHAYKGILLSDIERAYGASLSDHRAYVQTIPFVPPPPQSVRVRTLPEGEVHALWALLATREDPAMATEQIEKGLEEDPESLEPRYVRAAIDLLAPGGPSKTQDIALLRKKAPHEPRFLLLEVLNLLKRLGNTPSVAERKALSDLTEQLRDEGKTAAQRTGAASGFLFLRRIQEAVDLADEAVRIDPSCRDCSYIRAHALLAAGQPKAALEAAELALSLLHEDVQGRALELIRKVLEECRAAVEKAASTPTRAP